METERHMVGKQVRKGEEERGRESRGERWVARAGAGVMEK